MFVCVYIGVVDCSSSMQMATVVIANANVLNLNFDDSHGDQSESTLNIAVNWPRW